MNSNTRSRPIVVLCCISLLGSGLAGCKDKGPVEQLGEEVDEAVDTAKNGKESVATKADDAVDDLRERATDAAHDRKQK